MKKHIVTGWAQIVLSIVFLIGYFYALMEFIHGKIAVPIEWKDTLASLLSILTGSVMLIVHFWFQRSRESGENDANGNNGSDIIPTAPTGPTSH